MQQRSNFEYMPQVFFCHAYWSPQSAIVFGRCARVRVPSRQFLRGFSLWIFNAISSSVSFELLVGYSQLLWLDNPTTVSVFDPNISVSCFLRWMTGVLPCLHPCAFYFYFLSRWWFSQCMSEIGSSVILLPLPGKRFCTLQVYSNAPVGRNIVMQAMCWVCCLPVSLFCICCSKCT